MAYWTHTLWLANACSGVHSAIYFYIGPAWDCCKISPQQHALDVHRLVAAGGNMFNLIVAPRPSA